MSDINDTTDNHRPLDPDPDPDYNDAAEPATPWDGKPAPGDPIGPAPF